MTSSFPPHFGALLAATVLLAVLPGCNPGDTSFSLSLLESGIDGSLAVAETHEVTCTNQAARYEDTAANLIVVQGRSRLLTVEVELDECTGLPEEFTASEFAVQWSDDAFGVLGIDVGGSEAAGMRLRGQGDDGDTFVPVSSFEIGQVLGSIGSSYHLELAPVSLIPTEAPGVGGLCTCAGLEIDNLVSEGQVTENGDLLL